MTIVYRVFILCLMLSIAMADTPAPQRIAITNFPAIQPVSQSGSWTIGVNNFPSSTGRTWTLLSSTDSVSSVQSGTWTVGRSWTLSSGTDSLAAVQSGNWDIRNITGTVSLPTGASTSALQTTGNSSLSSIDGKLTTTANGLKVDGSAVTQPISAASLPLPTGAATSANQSAANTSLASIDAKTPALVSGRQPVDGSGVTQPISAASLPLPTGASTSANQTNGSQKTQIVDGSGNVVGPVRTLSGVSYAPIYQYKANTYSASIAGLSSASISTDLISIVGSSTKKVTITKLDVSAVQTNAGNESIQLIKRSSLDTGGGVATIVQTQSSYTTTNTSTASVTVTATGSGNLLVACMVNQNTRNISSVSDGTNAFTQYPGVSSTSGALKTDCWYLLSSTSGKTTITATFSGTSTTKSIFFWEIAGIGAALDAGATLSNGTTTLGGVDTGPSVTTTSADFVAAVVVTGGSITANPASGNEFISGGAITTGAAGASLLTGAGSHQPAWSDSGVLTTFGVSVASFKIAGNTQLTIPAIPNDSSDAAATGTVKYYLLNPTLGISVGSMRSAYITMATPTTTNLNGKQEWRFGNDDQKGIVLNGATESLNLNLSGTSLPGGVFDIDVEWKEE